jgi:exosortase A
MVAEPHGPPPAIEPEKPRPSLPPLTLVLVIVALLATFSRHFVWLVEKGWHNEYYGHGFLIPLISAYLIFRRKEHLSTLPRTGFYWGLPLIVIGLALHIFAIATDVNFVQGFGLVIVICGLVMWLWGKPVATDLAFPLIFLMFMVPMGRLLVDKFAQPMQLYGAMIAGGAASFAGIPVHVDGTSMTIPDYSFEVAIPCSGLKSAIALTALGAVYAYLLVGPMWKRWAIFMASLPVALVANGVRLWLTLVLAASLGPKTAEGFFHELSGILVFIIALAALFGIGSLIGCSQIREDI